MSPRQMVNRLNHPGVSGFSSLSKDVFIVTYFGNASYGGKVTQFLGDLSCKLYFVTLSEGELPFLKFHESTQL